MTATRYNAAALLLLVTLAGLLAGCQLDTPKSPSAPDSGIPTPGPRGTLAITVHVPNYGVHQTTQAKIIAPGTSQLRLLLDGTPFTTVSLSTTNLHGSWDFDTSGSVGVDVPAVTYGEVTVELLDVAGNPLTRGTAPGAVTVAASTSTNVDIVTFPVTSTPLTVGTSLTGETVSLYGMRYYGFPGVGGISYNVTVHPTAGTPDMFVFSATGLPTSGVATGSLGVDFQYCNLGFIDYTLAVTASPGGRYWVGVYGYSSATFDIVTTRDGGLSPYTDTFELDDTYNVATVTTVGSAAQQHFLDGSDEDWLKFYAFSGTTYVIETHFLDGVTSTDTLVGLVGQNGSTPITSDDDGGSGTFSKITWPATGTGYYYVKVTGYAGATGPYTVDIR
jgi:hypothetical protein